MQMMFVPHRKRTYGPPHPVNGDRFFIQRDYVLSHSTSKQTPWPLVRKRTIPTDRLPRVDEILMPTFVERGVSRGQHGGSPTVVNLSFLDRYRLEPTERTGNCLCQIFLRCQWKKI
jgi:hypothetical protein